MILSLSSFIAQFTSGASRSPASTTAFQGKRNFIVALQNGLALSESKQT